MSLTNIIRNAIINNPARNFQFSEIASNVGCHRLVAKQLYFSFLYYATEDYLQDMLKNSKE